MTSLLLSDSRNEKGAYMFGRADICDFVLEHPTISRFHAGMVSLPDFSIVILLYLCLIYFFLGKRTTLQSFRRFLLDEIYS